MQVMHFPHQKPYEHKHQIQTYNDYRRIVTADTNGKNCVNVSRIINEMIVYLLDYKLQTA